MQYKAFTIKNPQGLLRVIQTQVGFCAPRVDPTAALMPSHDGNAIWDTGATNSAVTPKLIKEMGLKPIGFTQVNTAGGMVNSPVYMVDIFLPNQFVMANMKVTELELEGADALIGMDVIAQGSFAVSSENGNTTVSFALPPIGPVDFINYNNVPRTTAPHGGSRSAQLKKRRKGKGSR